MSLLFFPGTDHPSDAQHLKRCCLSIHTLYTRRKPLECPEVFVDSGAFTIITRHGDYPGPVMDYARHLHRLVTTGAARITVASSQDYMCERFVVARQLNVPVEDLTNEQHGAQILENQLRTVRRYDRLTLELEALFDGDVPFHVLPVLQGYEPEDYVRHLRMYDARLRQEMWVGVGSVCKRNGSVEDIIQVLSHIKAARPDLRLHGFGLKITALKDPCVRAMLHSADSMAWSSDARKVTQRYRVKYEKAEGRRLTNAEVRQRMEAEGIPSRNHHDVREIIAFTDKIESYLSEHDASWQMPLLFQEAAE